jgi:prepilin-type N-terminal cleavage/methylation domain-containing protein
MRKPFRRAFTLVELLVVISIIALLISLLLPALQKARDSAEVSECQSTVKQICVALMLYEQDFGMFPVTVANRNHNSHGWAVNKQAVGNPNNTYWGGGGNANTDAGYFINPYCNLPATHNNGTNPPEMFQMFKCPSDQGRFDNPYMPGCNPPWGDIPWTAFEWQGTSYEWNGMVQTYRNAIFREPLTFANGVVTASPSYWSQGMFWRGAHEVRDPSRQILAGDPPQYPNYQELEVRGWAGCHDYMYNNHGPYEPVMNNGFLDGHVKFMHMKSYSVDGDHFVNADYTFMPDGYDGRLK